MTTQYGRAAVIATELQHSGECNSPMDAWKKAVEKIFPKKPGSQNKKCSRQSKGCPQNAYLGLCEDGLVKGVSSGKYTESIKNKKYAIDAVSELRKNPNLTENELWERVAPKGKTPNNQMGVVLGLWKKEFINLNPGGSPGGIR